MSVINREKFYAALAEIDREKCSFSEKVALEQAKIDEDFKAKMYAVHTYGSKYGEDIRDYCDILHELANRGALVSCCCYLPTSVDGARLDYSDDQNNPVGNFDCRCGIMFIDNETNMSVFVYPSMLEHDLRCAFDISFFDDNVTAQFKPVLDKGVKSYSFDGFVYDGNMIDKYDNLEYWHKLWYTFAKIQDVTPTLLVQLNEKFLSTVNNYSDRFLAAGKNELRLISSKVSDILTIPRKFSNGVNKSVTSVDDFDVDVSNMRGNIADLPISDTYHIDALSPKETPVSSVTNIPLSMRAKSVSNTDDVKLQNVKKDKSMSSASVNKSTESSVKTSVSVLKNKKAVRVIRSVPSVSVESNKDTTVTQMGV